MADIMELLKNAGVEVPEEKRESLNTELRKNYKHVSEVEKITTQSKAELESLTEQLKTANGEIESYKGMDIEGVKKSAEEYKTKFEEAQTAHAAELNGLKYDAILKDSLAGEKFSSDFARQGVFGEIKKLNLPLDSNNAIIGLQDSLKSLRESTPDAFSPEKPPATSVPGVAGSTPMQATAKEQAIADAAAAMGVKAPTQPTQ